MQNLTEKVLKLAPPGGLFDEPVVRTLFPDQSPGARVQLVHRAVSHGEVLRLKPGMFCLAAEYRTSGPHPFVVAGVLHSPSHVSLESALSHHGLIPEAVHMVSSVTQQRSRSFATPLGHYSFQRVPMNDPRAGVRAIRLGTDGWAFVATPSRAIADLVYLRKAVRWQEDGLSFLTESMRIEAEDLVEMAKDDLPEVVDSVRNRRTRAYLEGLAAEIGA